MKDDFLDFITSREQVPKSLDLETRELLEIALHPKTTISKFYFFQLLGMFLTLFICPQYGFYSDGGYVIEDIIMNYGPVFCGLFCSTVFFLGGLVLNYLFLRKTEFKWVLWNKIALVVPFILIIFLAMISTKDMVLDHDSHFKSLSFDAAWLSGAFAVMFMGLKILKATHMKTHDQLKDI